MKIFTSILCIFALLFFHQTDEVFANGEPASKNPLFVTSASSEVESNKPTLEIQSVEIYNKEDYTKAIAWAGAELSKEQTSSVDLATLAPLQQEGGREGQLLKQATQDTVESINIKLNADSKLQEVRVLNQQITKEQLDEIQTKSPSKAREFFERHHRMSFTLLRTTMNGFVTGSALILTAGVPVVPSLAIAIFSGVMAGGFQYFQPTVHRFINGEQEVKVKTLEKGMVGRIQVKSLQLTRIFGINLTTFFATQFVSLAVGAVDFSTPIAEAIKILKSTAMSTASSGIWSAANASWTHDALEANKFNPEVHNAIRRRATMISFSVSMVSAFGSILTLLEAPIGNLTMGVIGITGVAFSLWNMYHGRENRNHLITTQNRFNIEGLHNAIQFDLGCP